MAFPVASHRNLWLPVAGAVLLGLGIADWTTGGIRSTGIIALMLGSASLAAGIALRLAKSVPTVSADPSPDLRAELGLILNRDGPLNQMLLACSEAVLAHCSAAFVRIWILSESEPVLELQASVGLYTHTDGAHSRIPVGKFKIGVIAEERLPLLTNELHLSSRISNPEWARKEGMVAFAGHPLICGDVLVGVLGLFSRTALSPGILNDLKVASDAIALGISRKRTERSLRRGEARIRAIVNSALDCIITIDRSGNIIDFNPAAEKTFGYSRSEILGKELAELIIPGRHRDSHRCGMARYLATGHSDVLKRRLYGVLPAIRKDGSEFPTELTVVPLEWEGEPIFIGFLRDITEQKQAERLRTEAEAALQEAIVQAENANQAKNLFLANMSHEFRTPMGAVVGYAEMLLFPQLEPVERSNIVRAISRNGRHLLSLINDILDLSKIEAGKMLLELVPCKPWRIIGEAVSAALVRAEEKSIKLNVVQSGKLPRLINSDPTRLRQILDNLLSNAIKFTGEGKSVEFRTRIVEGGPDTNLLLIEIEDQGVGMSREVLDRLFEPFVQADASTARRFGGTGLGLSICRRLVEALHGRIEVSSEPDKGSRFSVYLPLIAADLDDLVDEESAARETHPAPLGFRPKGLSQTAVLSGRVLLAEDNPDNQNIIRFFLEKSGLNVEVAEDGEKAIQAARAGRFDFILMDMQMPITDGYTATRKIREGGYTDPIIALTAFSMSGDEQKCIAAGCDGYLTKPLELQRLINILNQLKRKAQRTPTNAPTPSADRLPESLPQQNTSRELEKLREDYLSSLAGKVEEFEKQLKARNHHALNLAAHRLRGSASMYGLNEVVEIAALIEDASTENREFDLIADLVAELRAACANAH